LLTLFSGFLQFKGNFLGGLKNSKYHDRAPLLNYFCCRSSQLRNGVAVYDLFTPDFSEEWQEKMKWNYLP